MKTLYMCEYIYIECSYTSQHTSGEDLVSVISVHTEPKPSLICHSIFSSSHLCDLHFITGRVFYSITDSLLVAVKHFIFKQV